MSDALRSLAHRYREQPAGTPGTRNPRATGSVADTSKPEDSQGVAGHGTPRTPGTPENSNVREEATDTRAYGSRPCRHDDATEREGAETDTGAETERIGSSATNAATACARRV